MRFDDIAYVSEFLRFGKYPAIHEPIFAMDKYLPVGNVLDVGCCTGLLSHRLATRHNLVLGIEPNGRYLENAVKKSNVVYLKQAISIEELPNIRNAIQKYRINIAYCRRVFPEIYDTGGMNLVREFIRTLAECGVKYVVLEGRKYSIKSVHKLCRIDLEVKCFEGFYKEIMRNADCSLLMQE